MAERINQTDDYIPDVAIEHMTASMNGSFDGIMPGEVSFQEIGDRVDQL